MMSLRSAIVRSVVPQMTRSSPSTSARTLSSQTVNAVEKLRGILEEYRRQNYTQEIPSRFKKDLVRAAATRESLIEVSGLQRVLFNIGASHTLSTNELQAIFAEIGNEEGKIPASKMLQLL